MKYSIIIPAFKAHFLDECLRSVLSQTVEDYEVVVLNDCSPEDIRGIVKRHDSPRLRYYENENNVGAIDVVDNWNKLLGLAQGEFIICMGDDDKLSLDYLEKINGLMEQQPGLDVYHARTIIIDEQSVVTDIQRDRPDQQSMYSFLWHADTSFMGDFCLRTEALRAVGGYVKFPLALYSDWATIDLLSKEKGIANLHEPIFSYRNTTESISNSGDARIKIEACISIKKWQEKLLEDIPQDPTDQIYRELYLKNLDRHFSQSHAEYMAEDMSRHFFSGFFHWIGNINRLKVSMRHFILACIKAIHYKRMGYYNSKKG